MSDTLYSCIVVGSIMLAAVVIGNLWFWWSGVRSLRRTER